MPLDEKQAPKLPLNFMALFERQLRKKPNSALCRIFKTGSGASTTNNIYQDAFTFGRIGKGPFSHKGRFVSPFVLHLGLEWEINRLCNSYIWPILLKLRQGCEKVDPPRLKVLRAHSQPRGNNMLSSKKRDRYTWRRDDLNRLSDHFSKILTTSSYL